MTYLPSHSLERRASLRKLASAVGLGLTLLGAGLAATPAEAAQSGSYLRVSSGARGATQSVILDVNKSLIVDLPASVSEVIASQPTVATVIMRTKTRAIVQGLAAGGTNVIFLDANGAQVSVLDITVGGQSNVGPALQSVLATSIPNSRIRVESVKSTNGEAGADHIVLTGYAQSEDDAKKAGVIAAQFAGNPENVANIIQVGGNQQVMLQVTVAEVDRSVTKQLGLDLNVSTTGGLITGLVNTPSDALGGASGISSGQGTVTASATVGPATIDATLKALTRRNAVRTLAEPTLTAISGQPAEFLAGGQRAIMTTDQNGNTITTFKDYGVQLKFTPTVRSDGKVDLVVDTAVSTPDGNTDFTTRSAKSTVSIPVGATLAIGGMIQDEVRQQISGMPGVGDIPILGALFRSRDFIHSQTELVILVTPRLAQIGRPELPTDQMHIAGDAEAVFLGHMEAMYGVENNGGMRGSYKGNVGFVLD